MRKLVTIDGREQYIWVSDFETEVVVEPATEVVSEVTTDDVETEEVVVDTETLVEEDKS